MKINDLSFHKKETILRDLADKISIVGANEIHSHNNINCFLTIRVKGNTNNVKAILRNYFDIDFYSVPCFITGINRMYADPEDIKKLCKVYIDMNLGYILSYFSKFDPLNKKSTIDKVVYQYGNVNYDRLSI